MSSEELQQWAKSSQFPNPIRWGDIEARIVSEPGPTPEESEELERYFPERGLVLRVLIGLLRALVVSPVVVPTESPWV